MGYFWGTYIFVPKNRGQLINLTWGSFLYKNLLVSYMRNRFLFSLILRESEAFNQKLSNLVSQVFGSFLLYLKTLNFTQSFWGCMKRQWKALFY